MEPKTHAFGRMIPVAATTIVLTILYVRSLQPYVGFWDTGEMQTVPYILGVAHPTGYPTVILMGWAFTHLVAFGNVAWRMNLCCALCYAATAGILVWSSMRAGAHAVVAIALGIAYGTVPLIWTHATYADVFAPTALLAAVTIAALDRAMATSSTRALRIAGGALGLALGTHLTTLWLVPGALVAVFLSGASGDAVRRLRTFGGPLVLGTLVYLYLPLASYVNTALRRDPTRALGIAPGRQFFDYAHVADPRNLLWLVTGQQVSASQSIFATILRPDLVAVVAHTAQRLALEIPTTLGVLVAIAILFAVVRRDVRVTPLLLSIGCALPFTAGFTAESEPRRYFIVSVWVLCLLGAYGCVRLEQLFANRIRSRALAFVIFAALFSLDRTLYRGGAALFLQPQDRLSRTYIDDVIADTPRDAVIVVEWVPGTPIAYAAYVEHRLDRRILDVGLPATEAVFFQRWLKRRPVWVIASAPPATPFAAFAPGRRLFLQADPRFDLYLFEARRRASLRSEHSAVDDGLDRRANPAVAHLDRDRTQRGSQTRPLDARAVGETKGRIVIRAQDVFAKDRDAATNVERNTKVRANVLVDVYGITVAHDDDARRNRRFGFERHADRAAIRYVADGAEVDHAGTVAGAGTSTKSRCSEYRGPACATYGPISDDFTPNTASLSMYGSPST